MTSAPPETRDATAPIPRSVSALDSGVGNGGFMIVGGATMAFAPVILTLMKPPPVTAKNVVAEGENVVVAELKGLGALLAGTPTFAILVVQGFFGGLPFTALSFRVLFFQTAGLTNAQASDIAVAIGIIGIIGGGFSGWLSDFLTR